MMKLKIMVMMMLTVGDEDDEVKDHGDDDVDSR